MILKYYLNFQQTTPNYLEEKATDKDRISKTIVIIFIVEGNVTLIVVSIGKRAFVYQRDKKKKEDIKANAISNEISPNSYAISQESFC